MPSLSLAACATDSLPAEVERPGVPEAIAVSEDNVVAFVVTRRASSTTSAPRYECATSADASATLSWRLRAPRAALSDAKGVSAMHFGGIDVSAPAGP